MIKDNLMLFKNIIKKIKYYTSLINLSIIEANMDFFVGNSKKSYIDLI
jgi:hypothetical protein